MNWQAAGIAVGIVVYSVAAMLILTKGVVDFLYDSQAGAGRNKMILGGLMALGGIALLAGLAVR